VAEPEQNTAQKLSAILDMDEKNISSRISQNAGFIWLKRQINAEAAQQIKSFKSENVILKGL
jgi:hypothetical protein